jgi:Pex19 protein family
MSSKPSKPSTNDSNNNNNNGGGGGSFMDAILDEALDELDDDDDDDVDVVVQGIETINVNKDIYSTTTPVKVVNQSVAVDETLTTSQMQAVTRENLTSIFGQVEPKSITGAKPSPKTAAAAASSSQKESKNTEKKTEEHPSSSAAAALKTRDKNDSNEKFRRMFREFVACGEANKDRDDDDDDDDDDKEEDELSKFMEQVEIHLESITTTKLSSLSPKKKKKTNATSTKATSTASFPVDKSTMDDAQQSLAAILNEMSNNNNNIEGNSMGNDGDEEKLLVGIFKSLGAMAGGELGGNGDDDDDDNLNFNPDEFVDGMMEQLLSKELMYEPMKQVTEKFPAWLDRHKNDLSEEELDQRRRQYKCFQQLVGVYESQDDSTSGSSDRGQQQSSRLMELMQEIQQYGQPPAEIVNEVAPGLELDEDGMPKLDGSGILPPLFGAGAGAGPNGEDCSVM